MCYQSGWLRLVQNHARHCFQAAFACHHLSLSRSPSVRQVVDLDLLLCTGLDSEHAYSETTASDQ